MREPNRERDPGAAVIGTDVASPRLEAARSRVEAAGLSDRVPLVRAPMDALPLGDASIDLVVAHGVWNLARSATELLRAGFEKDPPGPLTEYNRPVAGLTLACGGPVILEGTSRNVRRS